ncbi:MAG: type II toxin-antitoxin system RelE/ParE family toxin [Proteobacteria bacterium]|nr:type II toxin-antitoxin system RelE/ParE family toxin [Pseudomonadota bacterium]
MIKSFKDRDTRAFFGGHRVRRWRAIERQALRRLQYLNSAIGLHVLAALPSNRLHALRGDRAGQHSISINDQWRICFVWRDGHAYDVEIVDYH